MTSLQAVRRYPEVVAGLLVIAGLAWWSTVVRMAGMDAGPGTDLGTLGWFTGAWVVMMAAMMLPSLAPTAANYARLTSRRDPSPWLVFAAGGCSWALMAALFALGVMSLTWMGVIGALVALETLGPRPRVATSAAAALLALLAIAILAAPHDIPGLVVPGSASAARAMRAMG